MHITVAANQMHSTITFIVRVNLFIFNIEYAAAVLHFPIVEMLVGHHSVAVDDAVSSCYFHKLIGLNGTLVAIPDKIFGVELVALDEDVAAIVTLSEENRRMQDMMKMYGMADMGGMGTGETLILNANHPLVKFVLEHRKSQSVPVICAVSRTVVSEFTCWMSFLHDAKTKIKAPARRALTVALYDRSTVIRNVLWFFR